MLVIKSTDKKHNIWLKQQTKITDLIGRVTQLKWQWAGHVASRKEGRLTKTTIEWRPRNFKKGKGRLSTR